MGGALRCFSTSYSAHDGPSVEICPARRCHAKAEKPWYRRVTSTTDVTTRQPRVTGLTSENLNSLLLFISYLTLTLGKSSLTQSITCAFLTFLTCDCQAMAQRLNDVTAGKGPCRHSTTLFRELIGVKGEGTSQIRVPKPPPG